MASTSESLCVCFILLFFFLICFERDRERELGRCIGRGRKRNSSRPHIVSVEPDVGLKIHGEVMT